MSADTPTLDAAARRRQVLLRPLGWLLAVANADPGVHRRDFYALKDRLLTRFGVCVGEDVQRIVRECWGTSDNYACDGASCRRCGGTGVWDTSLILLQRWSLGGYVFHRPDRRVYGDGWRVTIEGRIEHRRNRRASAEAHLWLALLFDRRLFWRWLTTSQFYAWQWRPMLALQRLAFPLAMRTRALVRRFAPNVCWECHRTTRRPFARLGWLYCARCEREQRALYPHMEMDSDLPF